MVLIVNIFFLYVSSFQLVIYWSRIIFRKPYKYQINKRDLKS